jgi:hypothetical protein
MRTYTLTEDAINPKPDRRRKQDIATVPILKAGTQIIEHIDRFEIGGVGVEVRRFTAPGLYGDITQRLPFYDALLDTLTSATETEIPIAALIDCMMSPIEVLERLVEKGSVTREDIAAILNEAD